MTTRRAFLGSLASGLLAAPLAAQAQMSRRVPKLGVLQPGNPAASLSVRGIEALKQGLREQGYVEGQNIVIEVKYGDPGSWPQLASDLVTRGVDVIVAGGTPATLAAKHATPTIPIVGHNLADPVADGLIDSLARPGGNVTGNTFLAPELGPKRLQLLKELMPAVTSVAVFQHPGVYSALTMRNMLGELKAAATAEGVHLRVVEIRKPDEFDRAFAEVAKARIAALILPSSPMFYINYPRLVDLEMKHRLPTMYYFTEAVEAGGLICYGANLIDLARRSAAQVARILKGAKPADLPVEQPTKFELVINLKTAKALGLTIPPSLLGRADEVIQ